MLQDEAERWAEMLQRFEQKGGADPGQLRDRFPTSSGRDQAAAQAASARLIAAWDRYRAAKAALEACLGLPTGAGGPGGGSDRPSEEPAFLPPSEPPETGSQVM